MTSRTRALLTVITLSGAMSTLGAPAVGDTIRTETALGGFTVAMTASPLEVLLDDESLPIPRPPDTAVLEGDANFTSANLDTGPNARAVASSLWPGTLFGEGLPQVAPGAPQYPIKAESRYPDKPFTAQGPDGGTFTSSSALGLDVSAIATGAPKTVPGAVDVGSISSSSTATVTPKDVALGTSISKVSDLDLLAGIIHIGSVSTTITTHSDGKAPDSSGATTVSALSVAGQGYTVDDKGAHASGQTTALPAVGVDPLKALGITISGVVQTSSKDADSATRNASGLRITVNTGPLWTLLNPVTSTLNDPLGAVISQLPAQSQSYLYYFVGTTPKITFIIGAGTGFAGAAQALSFSFPPLPDLPGPAFPPQSGVGSPPGLGTAGSPVVPGGSAVTPSLPDTGQPVGQAPSLEPQSARSSASPSHGLDALALLGGGLVAGLLGWGLFWVAGMAFGGALLGPGCRLGAPTNLPNLRGA